MTTSRLTHRLLAGACLGTLAVAGLAAAPASAADADSADLYVLHAVPDTPVDVYVNGALTLDDFTPGSLAGPLDLPTGTYTVAITAADAADASAPVIGPVDLALEAGKSYTVAAHLKPGGLAAFHMPLSLKMEQAPPPPDHAVRREPIEGGRNLVLYVADRSFNPKLGRMDLLLDFVTLASDGKVELRSRERLTYYIADLTPYAQAVGLAPEGEPIAMGATGAIHLFRKG